MLNARSVVNGLSLRRNNSPDSAEGFPFLIPHPLPLNRDVPLRLVDVVKDRLRTPLDTNRVVYLNRDQESLVLDPYIVLERCPECKRPEVLLFDKLSDKKITYLAL